jgi:hypothetical protein
VERDVKTLADVLGVRALDKLDNPQNAASAPAEHVALPDALVDDKTSVEDFAKLILHSREYRQHLARCIILDELPGGLEVLLWKFAYGSPTERLEVEHKTNPFANLTLEQLEQRALYLQGVITHMRTQAPESNNYGDDGEESSNEHAQIH